MKWLTVQLESDKNLAAGLVHLKTQSFNSMLNSTNSKVGNYLISFNNDYLYIGESKNVNNRRKQHIKSKKSVLKRYAQDLLSPNIIDSVNFQILPTLFGRKEIEEFGIVNLPTQLNRFQKGKRNLYTNEPVMEDWDLVQKEYLNLLNEGFIIFEKIKLTNWYEARPSSSPGIYSVNHKTHGLIYIGESSNIYDRYNCHSKTTYFSALRRNIGTKLFKFKLIEKNGKKRYFTDDENSQINEFYNSCTYKFMEINIGRYELEEFVIDKLNPVLNIKSKSN